LFDSGLNGAVFTGAIIKGVNFGGAIATSMITSAQIYSTASYTTGDLSSIALTNFDLSGWNLAFKNLTGANFSASNLSNTVLTGANVQGATFDYDDNFTPAQLYSTATYQSGNLRGFGLSFDELRGWNFSGKDLTGADFLGSDLTQANFTGATLANADFRNADLRGSIGFVPSGALTENTIGPGGHIANLNVNAGPLQQLDIRNNPLPITVDSTPQSPAILGPTSYLVFHIDADPWGSTVTFQSAFSIQGFLELDLTPETDPASLLGRPIDLFNWGPVGLTPGDQFSEVYFDAPAGYSWDISQLYTTGFVELLPEPSCAAPFGIAAALMLRRRRWTSRPIPCQIGP
jgi:pentapeptide repeat protein